ncbi:hypothetical protein TWF696_008882 [Orbilia brochopaga]|uniref:Uncharacterized protein n=1 Tax=Orbilia brochopaga TaxID=3140254 RepID=A0AAV9UF28_9PEZI
MNQNVNITTLNIMDTSPALRGPDEFFFTFLYTRTRASPASPNISLGDGPRQRTIWRLHIKASNQDPSVLNDWVAKWIDEDIVAFYEPKSERLVMRNDILRIHHIQWSEGDQHVWLAVHQKKGLSFKKRLGIWGKLVTDKNASPLLYIEDLQRGRCNDTLSRMAKSKLSDAWVVCKPLVKELRYYGYPPCADPRCQMPKKKPQPRDRAQPRLEDILIDISIE